MQVCFGVAQKKTTREARLEATAVVSWAEAPREAPIQQSFTQNA